MNYRRLIFIAFVALGMTASAQETLPPLSLKGRELTEVVRLMNDTHYYAASRSLQAYLSQPMLSPAQQTTAEELSLVCDYYLQKPGTAEHIYDWLEQHPQALGAERLALLRANLMVKQEQYTAALSIYRRNMDRIYDMEQAELEETMICNAIALINNDCIDEADAIIQSMQQCKTHQMDMVYCEGYIKYVRGDYKGALQDFEIVKNNTDYARNIPVYMADCYLHTGEPAKSLSLLNNQLPLFSKKLSDIDNKYTDEIHRIRGEAYYDQNNYTKAVEALGQYVYNVEVPRRTALYKLGMSYFNTQEFQKAANALSRSAATANDEMAQNAWLNAGISYVRSQNKKQAQIAFQQASEMTNDKKLQEEALYNYALTLHEGNTMGFGESVNVFERFLNMFPQSQYTSSVSKHLAEVYFTTKNYPAALASINKIQNPSQEILQAKQKVLYNLGVQEFIAGNYQASDTYTNQAMALGSHEAVYIKGESEYRQGKYNQAINDLKQYLGVTARNQNNYGQALYTLGYAYFKQKQYNNANTYFNNFIGTTTANNNKTLKADALNRLADCLYTDRKYDEAYTIYQRALETDKQMGDYSLYQQAFIEGLRGNNQKKVELLSRMGGEYADSQYGADALYEQGRAYIQTGGKNQALQIFNQLIEKYPHSQKARSAGNEIGLIYFESGMTEEALKAYNRVIEAYPNTVEAQTALANLKDIYTDMGKVNEYAELARKAGKSMDGAELDQMINDAAVRSMNNGDYAKAYEYYNQLRQQTQSPEMLAGALEGGLRSAFAAKDHDAVVDIATLIIQDRKSSPSLVAEALLYRAESQLALGNAPDGIKDLQTLSEDTKTMYGAQASVRLAQYAYDTSQYQAAEQILQKFIDSGTSHQYWLARAFILLSDVYMKTDRKVEAREYLLSLKSNYSENEEINEMIKERLK
ncbi:MAG: tetratricopeptide repeat protein [Bacteroidaceae bacterium]|nr:tetratricopeptide repeat protein [Bacteroidaceae bacterium]